MKRALAGIRSQRVIMWTEDGEPDYSLEMAGGLPVLLQYGGEQI
jgi:hypothetical protein